MVYYYHYIAKIKLPFRVVIYLLKFFILEIYDMHVDSKKNEIVKKNKNGGFKMKDIFGYFKLDKFRKIFKLYEYLNINDDSVYYYASFIVSIKIKPVIVGYVVTYHDTHDDDDYAYDDHTFDINDKISEVGSIMSVEWLYILSKYNNPMISLSRKDLKPSNIKSIVILSFRGKIYLNDYPKLEHLQLDYNEDYNDDDGYKRYDQIKIYGYEKWKGILKSNTPEYVFTE